MEDRKAPGPDDIPVEVWKLIGKQGCAILARLLNHFTTEGMVPPEWLTSVTVPVWKGKGDVAECANYRPIRLLCHAMKIYERIIAARIREIVDLSPNQCGFVKGCGTTDAIHAVRLLLERYREKTIPIHMAFLDLEKAFDRVPHDLIWYALRSHQVPEAYVRWIKHLYSGVTSVVRCPVGTSPEFTISVGVHQGSALSPLVFILCMDSVTVNLIKPHPWTLLYADDVFLASEDKKELEALTNRWKIQLEGNGLRLNLVKTEYMECGQQTDESIVVSGEEISKVPRFKYLGSVVSSDGDVTCDVQSRINAAWAKWRMATGVLCDRRIPLSLKSKFYKTAIRPVALYGSECWPTTVKHEQALHSMEMRMLRRCLGLTWHDHVTNEDARKMLGVPPITEKLREQRLGWYGHVMRARPDSVAKTALNINPEGRRPRGRPKKRWLDRIKEDMIISGLKAEDAFDRKKWKSRCNVADPITGRRHG